MTERVDVAIIGAGQAGLATSWFLTQEGVEHAVLEAGRIAETWRSRRWDSFRLVTPNWSIALPGYRSAGVDPDGYLSRSELVETFQSWVDSFGPPLRTGSPVKSLDAEGEGFRLTFAGGTLLAKSVVVATGAYQRPFRPSGSEGLPPSVVQLFSEEYRNPEALAPGAVLVVGSGQTGCQLAEELHESGRKVYLACGRCPWGPRRMAGRDIVWWSVVSGFLDRTPDMLPSPAARLLGNVQATGHHGGHDLHYRILHQAGIELLGRFLGAEDGRIQFADDLAVSVDFGDRLTSMLIGMIRTYCEKSGTPVPDFELPPPMRIATRAELDVAADGVSTVIWTSGYRPDYDWVHLPVFDEMGFPVQVDGASRVPGLYFMGVPWMRKAKSSILWGTGEDAEIVARQIVRVRP